MAVKEAVNFIYSHIDNQIGLYASIGILALILIYLIRPKPFEKTIPSLLFLIKDIGKSKKESFFEKLLRDFLLIFHFLLVATLAVAATQPFYFSHKDVSGDNTVLVIDASASMNTVSGDMRFEKALSTAKKYLEGRISIVAIKNEPQVLLEKGKTEDAIEILNALKPSGSLSSIGNSILIAGNLLDENKGRIIVISDFTNTDNMDPFIAKKTLEAKGMYVEFINIGGEKSSNVGIVDADISEEETRITVQNYNDKKENAELAINGEKVKIELMPLWYQSVKFKNVEGKNTVKLNTKDDFSLDNEIVVFTPVKKKIKILLITNEEKSFILPALNAYKNAWNPEVEIDVAEPPKMVPIEHDVIIMEKVVVDKFPKASLDKIRMLVSKKGAGFVAIAHPEMNKIKFDDILPVDIKELKNTPAEVFNLQSLNEITKDVSFSKVNKYFSVKPHKSAIPLAAADDNTTIVAITDYGTGKIVYYGIMEGESKFKYDVSYPIFWQQLLDYLVSAESVSTLNYRSGDKIIFDEEQEVITPSRKVKASVLEFDEVGEYKIGSRVIYSNLLNNVESNINFVQGAEKTDIYELEKISAEAKKRLMDILVYALLALLFMELLYIKIRGDL